MENPLRVQAKVNELNLAEPRGLASVIPTNWFAVPGYFALTGFNNSGGTPVFNANFGYVVKIFVNNRTGEIRIFPFQLFE